jgi:hypothetical protein
MKLLALSSNQWVFQVFAVAQQLLIGGGQVFVLALVFPGEMLAHPDVGPAFAAADYGDAEFEGVPGAVGVGLCGLGLAEQVAETSAGPSRLERQPPADWAGVQQALTENPPLQKTRMDILVRLPKSDNNVLPTIKLRFTLR